MPYPSTRRIPHLLAYHCTVKVVVAKGVNRGIQGRPKGVKGRYKIVDARMKKEMRALKRIAKRK